MAKEQQARLDRAVVALHEHVGGMELPAEPLKVLVSAGLTFDRHTRQFGVGDADAWRRLPGGRTILEEAGPLLLVRALDEVMGREDLGRAFAQFLLDHFDDPIMRLQSDRREWLHRRIAAKNTGSGSGSGGRTRGRVHRMFRYLGGYRD